MLNSILLTEMECGNNGDIYRSCSDTIENVSTENLLKEVKSKYIPNDEISLNVTDEDIEIWIQKVQASIDTIHFDDQKYLTIATVMTDGGYDEYELEYQEKTE